MGSNIASAPIVTAMVSGTVAITRSRFFVAMFESAQVKPAADFVKEGFARIFPEQMGNGVVLKTNECQ